MGKYQDKYNKRTYTQVIIRLHNIKDIDIINKLGSVDSKNGYIKKLICEDMKKGEKK